MSLPMKLYATAEAFLEKLSSMRATSEVYCDASMSVGTPGG